MVGTHFIIDKNLIWQLFTIRQTAKLKSSPNFPTIRYVDGSENFLFCFYSQSELGRPPAECLCRNPAVMAPKRFAKLNVHCVTLLRS